MSYMDNQDKKIQEQVKQEVKLETVDCQIVDSNTSKNLEQAYLDGSLKKAGIIDTENFPQDVPDNETCKILDDLLSKNQLTFRQVKYCIISSNGRTIHMTDYFNEYNYDGRKFIRYQRTGDAPSNMTLSNNDTINKNKFYWIEVKPTDLAKDRPLYAGFTAPNSGRKR